MMTNEKNTIYIDFRGNPLPNHNGKCLLVNDDHGYQFFGVDGKGFLHDGAAIILPDGRKQFFLSDGTAIIHDGSPIDLPDGTTQYFDHEGRALWPVDDKKLAPLIHQQRTEFFKAMIARINKVTPLTDGETEDLRLALLAAEHPDSDENKNLIWHEDTHKTKLKPICDETNGALLNLEVIWHRVWTKYQLRHKETLASRFVLHDLKKHENCPLASLAISESMLANECMLEFKKAEKVILPPSELSALENMGKSANGTYLLDDLLLGFVSKMRKGEGTEIFKEEFKQAYSDSSLTMSSRIKAWKHPLFMYRCIAKCLWFNGVKARAEGAYRKPPALPLIVSDTFSEIMKTKTKFEESSGKILSGKGTELALIDRAQLDHIPSIKMATLQRILSPQNAKVLSSLNFHRLFRWEIQTVTKQIIQNHPDARMIHIPGGYQELANLIGAGTGGKACDQIRDILAWQAAPKSFVLHDKYGNERIVAEGNMLTFERIHGGNKSSSVNLVIGTMLMPHSVFKLLKSESKRLSSESVMLIPIPDQPTLIGKPNTYASQMSFQMALYTEMRKKAKELIKNGCIHISPDRMKQLAQESYLSIPFHLRVIDAWLADGNRPAFLSLVEKDHYALGKHFKQDQDFIVEGGKRELALSKAGKTSAHRKANGIFSKN